MSTQAESNWPDRVHVDDDEVEVIVGRTQAEANWQDHEDPRTHPAVRVYTLVCVAALVAVVMVLAARGLSWPALLPLLAGGAAALAGWSAGPPLVLLCVSVLLLVRVRDLHLTILAGLPDWLPMDLTLAAALLVYVAAQYRVQSMVRHIFPPDLRRRRRGRRTSTDIPLPPVEEPRSPDLVGPAEAARLVVILILVAALTALAWVLLLQWPPPWGFAHRPWALLVLAWLALGVSVTVMALSGWQHMNQAQPEQALMYLQDQLWRETRREQSRLNRWLVWLRLRRQRKAQQEGRV